MVSPGRGGTSPAPPDAGAPIPFDIVYCSSEDEPFPVTELIKDDDTPGHRGWQTAKNPTYPQSLVLRFPGDVDLRQIQVLSHECKIASKVDVRVFSLRDNGVDLHHDPHAVMPSFRDVRFSKLGAVGFNSNEKSKFRSKERKTVHLKSVAYFLKLNFQKCHPNALNTYHQVGVYSIVCCGYLLSQAPHHVDPSLLPPEAVEDIARLPPHHRTPSQMSEHGLPPIQGGKGMPWQASPTPQPQPQGYYTPMTHGGNHHIQPGQHYQGGISHTSPTYHTPAAPSLEPQHMPSSLPPIHRSRPGQFRSPPQKQNTAHPYDIPTVPDEYQSTTGQTFRSQAIIDFDLIYVTRTEELVNMKSKAVDEEDFDEAKVCKDALKRLHSSAQKVYDLERHKVRCIYSEDFDEAKHYKVEMDNYLGDLYASITGGVERFLGGAPAGLIPGVVHAGNVSAPRARRKLSVEDRRPVVDMPPIHDRPYVGAGAAKHSFEEEPVRSKYAIAMAQRREEHPSDDEAQEEGEGDDDPIQQSTDTDANAHDTSNIPDDVDASTDAGLQVLDAFDVASFPKWEQEVYHAIHAEAQDEPPAAPVAPAGLHVEAAESFRVLGNYMTSCLLSKKWKLREAAIRALSAGLPSPLYPHTPTASVVHIVLKFFEVKGCGLQDTIGNVFLAACVFVQQALQDKFECLRDVLPQALNLLPRFIARAGDATAKTRDEAAATVMAFAACSEVGINHVATTVLADPIDQDKRRIPATNHRVQLARLGLWQQCLGMQKSLATSMVDASVTRLILPCLNHNSNEVRDMAVSVASLMIDNGADITRYIAQVSNPAIKVALEAKAGGGGSSNNAAAPRKNNSAGRQRNTNNSAGRQRSNSASKKAHKSKSIDEG